MCKKGTFTKDLEPTLVVGYKAYFKVIYIDDEDVT
jgi:hypothetical protein